MRSLFLTASVFALFGSAALADEVIVKPVPGPVIEERATDEGTTTSKTVRHADGCTTKSVTHSDADKDNTVTHTQSNC